MRAILKRGFPSPWVTARPRRALRFTAVQPVAEQVRAAPAARRRPARRAVVPLAVVQKVHPAVAVRRARLPRGLELEADRLAAVQQPVRLVVVRLVVQAAVAVLEQAAQPAANQPVNPVVAARVVPVEEQAARLRLEVEPVAERRAEDRSRARLHRARGKAPAIAAAAEHPAAAALRAAIDFPIL